jgi:hypothetical protein
MSAAPAADGRTARVLEIAAAKSDFDSALRAVDRVLVDLERARRSLCETRAALIVARQRELAARLAGSAPDAAP